MTLLARFRPKDMDRGHQYYVLVVVPQCLEGTLPETQRDACPLIRCLCGT